MNARNIIYVILLSALLISVLSAKVGAQEEGDVQLLGLELEKLLSLINAWIALFLFVVSLIAYKRDGRKRLLYVSIAFLLFSIKSFLLSSELLFPEISLLDPLAVILEFLVLISFFYGVLKR